MHECACVSFNKERGDYILKSGVATEFFLLLLLLATQMWVDIGNICTCMPMHYDALAGSYIFTFHSFIHTPDLLRFSLHIKNLHFSMITLGVLNHTFLVFLTLHRLEQKSQRQGNLRAPFIFLIDYAFFSNLFPCEALCSLQATPCQTCVALIAARIR